MRNGSEESDKRELNTNLKIIVEEIIESKLLAGGSSEVISSGHPGFASTFKIAGVT